MPIFEYQCPDCRHQFETLVRRNEAVACPECGANEPEKLISTTAAHVSGSSRLPIAAACPPSDAPPCGPGCCRLPAD